MTNSSDLNDQIVQAVRSHWLKNQSPILLSDLGMVLDLAAKAKLKASELSLLQYLSENLSEEIRVLSLPKQRDVAAPRAETAELSDEDLSLLFFKNREKPILWFRPDIFNAFRNLLNKGQDFIINTSNESVYILNVYGDFTESSNPNTRRVNLMSIGLDAPLDHPASNRDVSNSIRKWISDTEIPISRLLQSKSERQNSGRTSYEAPLSRESSTKNQLLGQFSPFTDEELRRIMIPADVVAAALRRANDR